MAQYGADGRVAATQVGDEASHGSLLAGVRVSAMQPDGERPLS